MLGRIDLTLLSNLWLISLTSTVSNIVKALLNEMLRLGPDLKSMRSHPGYCQRLRS